MTAKEHFESEWQATPREWEWKPFKAVAKFEFGAFAIQTKILLIFKAGEVVEPCTFADTYRSNKQGWGVRFSKAGLMFELPASDFFQIFDA